MKLDAKMRQLLDELCLGNVEQVDNLPGIGAKTVAKALEMGLIENVMCPMLGKMGIGLTLEGKAASTALRKV